jgi:hypothetical protein
MVLLVLQAVFIVPWDRFLSTPQKLLVITLLDLIVAGAVTTQEKNDVNAAACLATWIRSFAVAMIVLVDNDAHKRSREILPPMTRVRRSLPMI